MSCFGPRFRNVEVRPEQRWDAINLRDFKSTSCGKPFAYCYLWFSLCLSCAVYGVDSFTAINLIAFDKWSSEIQPTQLISFDIVKWVFAICIILSFVNLAFEHFRAWRVMRRGSVAESYMDSLAVRLESIKFGDGHGWRRFLVFAELTKSKKGAEYIALFTYFSFQSWIRVCLCSGPRQILNALTLYAVYSSSLIPTSDGDVGNTIMNFFSKLETLAEENYQEVLILCGMIFTLVIWIFSAISLLLASLFYVFFLWHYIPRQDGGLSGYCERKVNKRLMKIVSVKVNKAIAKEERARIKAELKAAKKAGEKPSFERHATLPNLADMGSKDSLPQMPTLQRNETTTTLPAYTSRPGTPSEGIEMDRFNRPPMPSRQGTTTTLASQSSYGSRTPLLSEASAMGSGRPPSPVPSLPSLPPIDLNNHVFDRPGTAQSNRNFGPSPAPSNSSIAPPPGRSLTTGPNDFHRPPPRTMTDISGRTASPFNRPQYDNSARASPAPFNPNFDQPARASPAPFNPSFDQSARSSPAPFNPNFDNGRASPAPSYASGRGPLNGPGYNGPAYTPQRSVTNPPGPTPLRPNPGQPQRNMTAPMPQQRPSPPPDNSYYGGPPPRQQYPPPQRNMTAPMPPRQTPDPFYGGPPRPGTAQSQRPPMPQQRMGQGMGPGQGYAAYDPNGYNNDLERGPRY